MLSKMVASPSFSFSPQAMTPLKHLLSKPSSSSFPSFFGLDPSPIIIAVVIVIAANGASAAPPLHNMLSGAEGGKVFSKLFTN
jgi:hypothetical protein